MIKNNMSETEIPLEVRLDNFRKEILKIKVERPGGATLFPVVNLEKLGPEEMEDWEKYKTVLQEVDQVSWYDQEKLESILKKARDFSKTLLRPQKLSAEQQEFLDWIKNRLGPLMSDMQECLRGGSKEELEELIKDIRETIDGEMTLVFGK